jgi:hypothetical protein
MSPEKQEEERQEKSFLLKVVQPSLIGLMDGSVSTIGPIFAAGFASGSSHIALVVGISASFGAGISMAFAEALSDTGEETGRGRPIIRGAIVGLATFLGGILHSLPFLINNLRLAIYLAFCVVGCELIAISFLRYYYFKVKFLWSFIQVVCGGLIVLLSSFFISKF